jgi:Zn-dependent protease with chaperone function
VLAASIALAVLAAALAVPVPIALGRARWPARSPAVALLLCQSIALAGGLSMIGALLVFGLAPFGDNLIAGAMGLAAYFAGHHPPGAIEAWHLFALWGAVLLSLHLGLTLVLTVVRSERQRRRHAQLVTLLSSPLSSTTRLIDTPTPVAYCLPGALSSVTVFSAGLVDLLSDAELGAVIEHEKAHVVQRHDVVLVAFRAWNAALPWFPIASRAQREVGLLVEMLADDRARTTVPDAVLATAITLVGGASTPDSVAEAARPSDIRQRVLRLALPPLPVAVEAVVVGAAAALLGVPTALLILPGLIA